MSRGKKLQEMEVKTQQSKSAVNANAKPGDPMPKLSSGGTPPTYEDLGAQLQRTTNQMMTQQR